MFDSEIWFVSVIDGSFLSLMFRPYKKWYGDKGVWCFSSVRSWNCNTNRNNM